MPSVLVTGANRGLGLGFCQHYAVAGWQVFACCRQPENAQELQTLVTQYPLVTIHKLDVSDFNQIQQLGNQLADQSLDIVIHNAGVYYPDKQPQQTEFDYISWEQTFKINTLAPVKLSENLLPSLMKSDRRLIVAITSLMGSIADNGSGGSLAYRSSKSALNAAMKSLSIDWQDRKISVLILHPGWVKTDMGGEEAPTSIYESISGMTRVIESFTLAQSGQFLNFKNQLLPW
ncbi:MAG: hypothetical protein RL637_71 [Pseudomonadota bacterium]|jgi:NAD(P)-dependent dehydrogenase (short-subunit alcohol dehydrogenase family)